jgi:hypothetical protein
MDQSPAPLVDALAAYHRRHETPFTPPGHKQGRGAGPRVLAVLGDDLGGAQLRRRPAPGPFAVAGGVFGDVDGSVKRLAVMVVNRGSFTITRIEAQFSYDGKSLVSHAGYRRLSGFGEVRERLRKDWSPSSERAMYGILTPLDAGIRFESDEVHVQNLKSPYPLVRWTDRWGTRWEHRLGEVRQVADGQEWAP